MLTIVGYSKLLNLIGDLKKFKLKNYELKSVTICLKFVHNKKKRYFSDGIRRFIKWKRYFSGSK